MDFYSLFPDLFERIASPRELVVDANLFGENPWLKLMIDLEFLYGSLPRPPYLQSIVVCMWFLNSLSKHIAFGYLSVDDDVAIWRFSEYRCVTREMEIWLERFQQNLGYIIDDGWLVMLLEHYVFTFRTYVQLVLRECNKDCLILVNDLCKFTRFIFFVDSSIICCGVVQELCTDSEGNFMHQIPFRKGENLKYDVHIYCLNLCEADCCGFLQLESSGSFNDFHATPIAAQSLIQLGVLRFYQSLVQPCVLSTDQSLAQPGVLSVDKILVQPSVLNDSQRSIGALVQHLSFFVKTEACCCAALLTFVAEILLQFHSCVETHMRRMERMSSLIDRFFQFHSCATTHMRRMGLIAVMEVILFSCLKKGNDLSSNWFDLHVIIGSQGCVSRQREIWPRVATLIHEDDCIFARTGWIVMMFSPLPKEEFLSSNWMVCHQRHASSTCVTRQGEIWSIKPMYSLMVNADEVFASNAEHELLKQSLLPPLWFVLASLDEQQMVRQIQFFLKSIQSHEDAAFCLSKELISVTSTWNLCGFLMLTITLNANGDGDFVSHWPASQFKIFPILIMFFKSKMKVSSILRGSIRV